MPVLFLLSSAREMANALCPFFQRSHSSAFCFAVKAKSDKTFCPSGNGTAYEMRRLTLPAVTSRAKLAQCRGAIN